MNEEEFWFQLKEKGIILSADQLDQFKQYFQLLIEWNNKINLTAITDKEEVYRKHFYDSLTPAFNFEFKDQLIFDIGSGAGFPSIPLKIVYPNLNVRIIDSLNKRITFLNHLIKELKLTGVTAVNYRAEDYAKDHREEADIVIARAVARLNILNELCLPLVKENGYFISLKGKQAYEELAEAQKGTSLLGGELDKADSFVLAGMGNRTNLFIKKVKACPDKYPRSFGTIKKKPL